MQTRRLELLSPDEILEELRIRSVAYLPLGPLEWYGPHLPEDYLCEDSRSATVALGEKHLAAAVEAFVSALREPPDLEPSLPILLHPAPLHSNSSAPTGPSRSGHWAKQERVHR